MADQLADEQRNVRLFAFGVGRGVDRGELQHMVAASAPGSSADVAERYHDLYVREEAPW